MVFNNIINFVNNNQEFIYSVIFCTHSPESADPILTSNCWPVATKNLITAESINRYTCNIEINNIWFFGLHWNKCVSGRPVGWKNLYKYFKEQNRSIRLMTRSDCVLSLNNEQIEYFPDFKNDLLMHSDHHGNWMINPQD
jgi:hypothetical protein